MRGKSKFCGGLKNRQYNKVEMEYKNNTEFWLLELIKLKKDLHGPRTMLLKQCNEYLNSKEKIPMKKENFTSHLEALGINLKVNSHTKQYYYSEAFKELEMKLKPEKKGMEIIRLPVERYLDYLIKEGIDLSGSKIEILRSCNEYLKKNDRIPILRMDLVKQLEQLNIPVNDYNTHTKMKYYRYTTAELYKKIYA